MFQVLTKGIPIQSVTSCYEHRNVEKPDEPFPIVLRGVEAQENKGVIVTRGVDPDIEHLHALSSLPDATHCLCKGISMWQQFPMEIYVGCTEQSGLRMLSESEPLPLRGHC